MKFGDPWENRTPVIGVRGRCLNRLTNGPYLSYSQMQRSEATNPCSDFLMVHHQGLEPGTP